MEEVILGYVNSGCKTIREYCNNYNVNSNYFSNSLRSVKKNNKRLYSMYMIKSNHIDIDNKKGDFYLYKMLCWLILNGLDDRKIDLLDLGTIPKFSFWRLDDVAAFCLNRRDYNTVCEFIKQCNYDLKDLVKNNNKMDNDVINDYLSTYNIVTYLYSVCVSRINNNIDLDDLVINIINYVNKRDDVKIKKR